MTEHSALIKINGKPKLAAQNGGRLGWVSLAIRTPGSDLVESVHSVPDWWWLNPNAWTIHTGGNTYAKG